MEPSMREHLRHIFDVATRLIDNAPRGDGEIDADVATFHRIRELARLGLASERGHGFERALSGIERICREWADFGGPGNWIAKVAQGDDLARMTLYSPRSH